MSILAYCRRPACAASPDESLRDAARRMEKQGVGLLVVTEGDRLTGVLTDRDVALHVAARGRDAARTRVGDALSAPAISVSADLPLEEGLGILRSRRVRRLPVVDADGRVAGVVSADDLVRLLAREIGGLGEVLVAQLPAGASRAIGREAPQRPPRRAAEHYGREVVIAPAGAAVAEIARHMEERAVGSVVLLDAAGRGVGLLTDRDIALRVVAAGVDPATTAASSVLSAPLIGAAPSEPLEEVVERMRTAGIRRIPVLRDGRPVGIVTFDDLLVAFGNELDQLGACVAREMRAARVRSQGARFRLELEERIEEAAAQLRHLGDQTLRALGGELEQVADRVARSIRRAGARAAEHAESEVRDLMRADVRSCREDDALNEAARIMWDHDCGCVPVLAGDGTGRVVGMITDRDVCMAAYTRGARLSELPVREVMARPVLTCRPEDPLSKAGETMRTGRVRRLPVVAADGRLEGILSLADLAGARSAAEPPVGEREVARTLAAICQR